MKNKIVLFCMGLGVPLTSINNSCTGLCGNCQLNCAPGILLVVALTFKYFLKKIGLKGFFNE